MDQARDVSMAPLEFQHMPASEYLDRATYLGHESIRITDTFRPKQAFPIHSNCHTWGQFIGGGMLDILLDTGASKSYMSKDFT